MLFNLYQGRIEEVCKLIPCPINCIILRSPINIDIPILPSGSIWVSAKNIRGTNGELSLCTEEFIIAFKRYHLADKITWNCGNSPINVLDGTRNHNYLSSSGYLLRFTPDFPEKSWTNKNVTTSVWERTIDENYAWYVKQIEYTCPLNGLVLDPICTDGLIAEACLRLGRQFVGIGDDIKVAEKHINNIALKLVKE